ACLVVGLRRRLARAWPWYAAAAACAAVLVALTQVPFAARWKAAGAGEEQVAQALPPLPEEPRGAADRAAFRFADKEAEGPGVGWGLAPGGGKPGRAMAPRPASAPADPRALPEGSLRPDAAGDDKMAEELRLKEKRAGEAKGMDHLLDRARAVE